MTKNKKKECLVAMSMLLAHRCPCLLSPVSSRASVLNSACCLNAGAKMSAVAASSAAAAAAGMSAAVASSAANSAVRICRRGTNSSIPRRRTSIGSTSTSLCRRSYRDQRYVICRLGPGKPEVETQVGIEANACVWKSMPAIFFNLFIFVEEELLSSLAGTESSPLTLASCAYL